MRKKTCLIDQVCLKILQVSIFIGKTNSTSHKLWSTEM